MVRVSSELPWLLSLLSTSDVAGVGSLWTSSRGECDVAGGCAVAHPRTNLAEILECSKDSGALGSHASSILEVFRAALEKLWNSESSGEATIDERLLAAETAALHVLNHYPNGHHLLVAVPKALKGLEPQAALNGFCFMGYLAAVFVLMQRPERHFSQKDAKALANHLLGVISKGEMSLLWFFSVGWPIPAAEMLNLLQVRDLGITTPIRRVWPTETQHKEGAWPTETQHKGGAGAVTDIVAVGGHMYIFDSAIATREAGRSLGLEPKLSVFGFVLEKFTAWAAQLCIDLGDICVFNRRLHDLQLGLTDYEDKKWEDISPRNMPSFLKELRGFLRESFPSKPALAICGYPYIICFGIERVQPSLNLLLVIQGTVLTEYVSPKVYPWLFRRFLAWADPAYREKPRMQQRIGCRSVLVHDHIDQHLYDVALGVRLPHVLYGARQVATMIHAASGLELGTSRAATLRSTEPRFCLVSGLQKAIRESDSMMFFGFITSAASVLEGRWNLDWRFEGYEYVELLKYSAAVMIPWDWEITTFFDWYRMNLPLFLPSEKWMVALISWSVSTTKDRFIRLREYYWKSAAYGQGNWSKDNITGRWTATMHQRPWIDSEDPQWSMVEQVVWWYQFTDFVQTPHLHYFESPAELVVLLDKSDLKKITMQMQQYNKVSLRTSLQFYRSILLAASHLDSN